MCSVDIEAILHPEFLPPDLLLRLLQERKLKIDGLESMTKQELIEVYNQFCRPQQQRKYRDTLRGKTLSKQQEEKEKQCTDIQNITLEKISLNSTKSVTVGGRPVDSRGFDYNKRKLSETQLESPDNKRKYSQNHHNNVSQPEAKKLRTKITWP